MKKLSKMILVCSLMTLSEGWQKLLEQRGTLVLAISSLCKMGIDITSVMIKQDNFVLWGEVTVIIISALYLIGD